MSRKEYEKFKKNKINSKQLVYDISIAMITGIISGIISGLIVFNWTTTPNIEIHFVRPSFSTLQTFNETYIGDCFKIKNTGLKTSDRGFISLIQYGLTNIDKIETIKYRTNRYNNSIYIVDVILSPGEELSFCANFTVNPKRFNTKLLYSIEVFLGEQKQYCEIYGGTKSDDKSIQFTQCY